MYKLTFLENNLYMSKFNFVNLIDKIFVSIGVFLIIFSWINFYILSLWTTFVLSLIFSFAVLFIIFYIFSKKQEKLKLNKKTIEEINQSFLDFKLLSKNDKINLINSILLKEHSTQISNDYIIYLKENKKHLVYLNTKISSITQDDLFNILEDVSQYNFDVLDVICHKSEKGINKTILKNIAINFIDKELLYLNYFQKYQIFPKNDKINKEIFKPKFKDFLSNFISQEKSKGYFISGLVLLFSSILLPFNTYFIVFGSVLMMFAIVCKLMKFKDYWYSLVP